MLGARAARLLEAPPPVNTASGSSSRPAPVARLSSTQRCARWIRLTVKLLWVVRSFMIKKAVQAVLGDRAYNRIFHQVRDMNTTTGGTPQRIVQGQLVGRRLEDSAGRTQGHDSNTCPHEDQNMKARGNLRQMWWTCLRCGARWERSALPTTNTTEPATMTTMMTSGRYAGRAFGEIFTEDQHYVQWAMMSVEMGDATPEINRFARFAVTMERTQVWNMADAEVVTQDSEGDPQL